MPRKQHHPVKKDMLWLKRNGLRLSKHRRYCHRCGGLHPHGVGGGRVKPVCLGCAA